MSGFKTAAPLALVALVTAGILSVLTAAPAHATEQATTPTTTFAATTAAQVYTTLHNAVAAEEKAAAKKAKRTAKKAAKKSLAKAKHKSPAARRKSTQRATTKAVHRAVTKAVAAVPAITDPTRLATLPATLSAPILHEATIEGALTFHTGSEDTAACLDLRTGVVTTGRCQRTHEPLPVNLTYTYDTFVRTVQWFDAHSHVYGQTAQSVDLIAQVVATEIPAHSEVAFIDADADALVDGGEVTLSIDGSCGTVVLPEHDPTGTTYTARLLHGTC